MPLNEETLNKFETYINAIGELITVVASHLSATYQATTQIKSYAVKKKLSERMKYTEQKTQPPSLFALTQLIEERYTIVQKFNKGIKRPFIPIPLDRDTLNALLNDLLNNAFEKGTSFIEYTEESKKITIIFRDLLNGNHHDYYLIEMCNTMCDISKQQNGPLRNQYEVTLSNLFTFLGLEGDGKDDPDIEITKFHFTTNMIRSQNMVLKYLNDFIMYHCQAAARINSIIKGVAEGFIDPSKFDQNINDNLATELKISVGVVSDKHTQTSATTKENTAELTTEQIRDRWTQINSKVESVELLQEQLMLKFPALYSSTSMSDELSSKTKFTGNELQLKEAPNILKACLNEASAWRDRINNAATMGYQNIPDRDKELATLNAITYNYWSKLADSITYLNQISEISDCLKKMKIIPNEPEEIDISTTQKSQLPREKVKPSAPVSGANGYGSFSNGATSHNSIMLARYSLSDSTSFLHTHKKNLSIGDDIGSGGANGIQTELPIGSKHGAKTDLPIAAIPAVVKSPGITKK